MALYFAAAIQTLLFSWTKKSGFAPAEHETRGRQFGCVQSLRFFDCTAGSPIHKPRPNPCTKHFPQRNMQPQPQPARQHPRSSAMASMCCIFPTQEREQWHQQLRHLPSLLAFVTHHPLSHSLPRLSAQRRRRRRRRRRRQRQRQRRPLPPRNASKRTNERTSERTNERTNFGTNERTNFGTNGRTNVVPTHNDERRTTIDGRYGSTTTCERCSVCVLPLHTSSFLLPPSSFLPLSIPPCCSYLLALAWLDGRVDTVVWLCGCVSLARHSSWDAFTTVCVVCALWVGCNDCCCCEL